MRIFIDGAAGATGLALEERLVEWAGFVPGIELIKPAVHLRKDTETRRAYLNEADAVFLCLPDTAAREAVAMVENPRVVVIDASTAHRTTPGWAYGFPELSPAHRQALETSNRIAVPGCHASGFVALVYPLVKGGFINPDDILYCHSLTGYSGGGKSMIEEYENDTTGPSAARLYALALNHKHLPEMTYICGLRNPPIFAPVVVNTRQGMMVSVPLACNAMKIADYLSAYYKDEEQITVKPYGQCQALEIEDMNGTDGMEIFVSGHEKQTLLTARFDNLGKGSSGAALNCLKVRMGLCRP